MEYRWLNETEIIELVNPVLSLRGWPQLSILNARVRGAFDGDNLIEVFVVQLLPTLGPMVKIDNTHRDNGTISRELTSQINQYLEAEEARGYIVIADSPLTERLCERYKMEKITSPVFMHSRP